MLKWYLGVQSFLCICVFSNVSRLLCRTGNHFKDELQKLELGIGIGCICLFMWKMFYVLFIPYCNYDDSYINSRTLINFTPYRTWSLGLFCWSVKLHIVQVGDIRFTLKYLQFPSILIVKLEKACSCAYVCKLGIWLPTSTVSGVQQLFSGEI